MNDIYFHKYKKYKNKFLLLKGGMNEEECTELLNNRKTFIRIVISNNTSYKYKRSGFYQINNSDINTILEKHKKLKHIKIVYDKDLKEQYNLENIILSNTTIEQLEILFYNKKIDFYNFILPSTLKKLYLTEYNFEIDASNIPDNIIIVLDNDYDLKNIKNKKLQQKIINISEDYENN